MEVSVVFDIQTDENETIIESSTFVVNEINHPIGDVGHNHDDRYYTKAVIDEKLEDKLDKNTYIFGGTF